MKGLVLKDIYNISNNNLVMLLALIILAPFTIPSNGALSFMVICVLLGNLMLITSFSLDELSKWDKYALISPIRRKDIVSSKYLILFLFSIVGAGFGTILSFLVQSFIGEIQYTEILKAVFISLGLSMFFGSVIIPLLYKFGAEKARIIMIFGLYAPIILYSILADFLTTLQIPMPSQTTINLFQYSMPLLIVVLVYLSYRISLNIFANKEI